MSGAWSIFERDMDMMASGLTNDEPWSGYRASSSAITEHSSDGEAHAKRDVDAAQETDLTRR